MSGSNMLKQLENVRLQHAQTGGNMSGCNMFKQAATCPRCRSSCTADKDLKFIITDRDITTLLQCLTLISGTQTGCRRLDSYIEQQTFLACGPEFSVEFSAPPEFSGGVTEKYLSTGWARTFDLQIRKQIFYHCATAPLCTKSYDIHCVPSWDFPAVSVVTGSRIFRPYLVVTCRDFPALSAVTGSQNFRPYM
jgi:hypothetical protein